MDLPPADHLHLPADPEGRAPLTTVPIAFAPHELHPSPRNLDAVLDVVLSSPARLATNIVTRSSLAAAIAVLCLTSLLFAIPFGTTLGVGRFWTVIALFLGSTLICFPSLHVFAIYLGVRVRVTQSLTLALVMPAAAATFSLGFAPIYAFLRGTLGGDATTEVGLRLALLTLALAGGIGQLWRCVTAIARAGPGTCPPAASGSTPARLSPAGLAYLGFLLAWHVVFLYVTRRMAAVLGLDA